MPQTARGPPPPLAYGRCWATTSPETPDFTVGRALGVQSACNYQGSRQVN